MWRKCEFLECTFETCSIRDCEISKVEFDDHIFKNCEFKHVDFGWSYFADCQFLEVILDGINFEGTIMRDLKIKSTISLNLHFNEKLPMNFWKCGQLITIKDSFSFEELLRDSQLE